MPDCCARALWSEPRENDIHRCTCGRTWIAQTKPHVGVPTWWEQRRDNVAYFAEQWAEDTDRDKGFTA